MNPGTQSHHTQSGFEEGRLLRQGQAWVLGQAGREGFLSFQQQYGFKTLSQGPGALLDAKVARLVLTHLLQADKEEFSGAVLGQISSQLFSSLLHRAGRPSGSGCAEPGDRGALVTQTQASFLGAMFPSF